MSESPIKILATDRRWPGPWHVEEGPDCLCSRCGLAIEEPEIAIRAWPEDANAYSYRFHPVCLGFQAYDPRDEAMEPDDPTWPPRPGEDDDEITRCPYCGEADCDASCTAALVQDDRPREDDVPALGPCCVCEGEGPQVRTLMLLDFEAPEAGTGWGCLVCDLPCDGAFTVLCDACLDRGERPRFIVQGTAESGLRAPYPLPEQQRAFRHDPTRHPGEVFPEDDDAPQPCGHPWSAVVWLDDETGDCGACLKEEEMSIVLGPSSLARDHGPVTKDTSAAEEEEEDDPLGAETPL